MKILQFLIYIPACLLILSACDKNEDNETGGQPDTEAPEPEQPGTEAPKPEQLDIIPVHTITYGERYSDYSGFSYYKYENGAMVSGYDKLDGLNFVIKKSPLEIVMTNESDSDGDSYNMRYYNIKTNSFGSITSVNISSQEVFDDELYTLNGTIKAEYNSSGQITKMITTFTYNEDGESSQEHNQFSFQYKDGNLIKEIDDYGDGDTESILFNYDNGNLQKNTGVFIEELTLDSPFMYYAGLWGKPSKNIPNSYTYTYEHGSSEDPVNVYVQYDNEGRVSQLEEDGFIQKYGYEPVSFVNNRSAQQKVKKHSPRLQKLFRRK